MHTSRLTTEQMKFLIENKINHKYIDNYIEKPNIDEEKLNVLSVIVSNTSLPSHKKRQYIISTMLIQIALDTHELVQEQINNTSKQIKVLAGDYYSGLYYLLLSEIEEFELISTLAAAIKEINELKMKLYYEEIGSFHEFINTIQQIDSLLIIRVAEFLNDSIMANIAGDLLLTNKLMSEKKNFLLNGFSPLIDKWQSFSINNSYPSTINLIDNIIQENTEKIAASLSQSPIHLSALNQNLRTMLTKLVSYVEEG